MEKKKLFQKFTVKDIVFLAIISAVTLVTSAVMPLVVAVPVFGIIQAALGFQFSVFPAIGVMKVRKPGSVVFVAIFSGIVLVFMNPVMFACLALCAVLAEAVSLAIFKGYEKDAACFISSALYLPLSLPFLHLWYKVIGIGDSGEAVKALVNPKPPAAALMSLAVIAICCLGAFVGVKISKELRKSGALKK